jgi:hypothetical protein
MYPRGVVRTRTLVILGFVVAACVVTAILALGLNRGSRTFSIARGQTKTFAPGEVREGDRLTCSGQPSPAAVSVQAQSEQFSGWSDTSGLAYQWLEDGSLTLSCSAPSTV